jgi:hypothetical protein
MSRPLGWNFYLPAASALRRGELDTEEAAEVEAVNAAFEGRLVQIRERGGLS